MNVVATDAMDDEFDTVAEWTAQVAIDLGPDHYVPAGCRGSGGPGALGWLVDALEVTAGDRMLDCGAGVGGPAGFAAARVGVRPVLAEPEDGACRAARRLFGLPTVCADGAALPFASATFDVAWCLAVLCTTPDQQGLLSELRRVLGKGGRLGVLAYTAQERPDDPPEGNVFVSDDELGAIVRSAGFVVESAKKMSALDGEPPDWSARVDAVQAELERRHHGQDAWATAQDQAARFGRLVTSGQVVGSVLALRAV